MKQLYVILFTLISFFCSAQELLKDINTSNASSHPRNMVNANGKHFFIAKGVNTNSELWVTDGSNAGTIQLTVQGSDNAVYVEGNLFSFGDKIIFPAYYYIGNNYQGTELWVSDGTVSGTKLLKDINPFGSSYPNYFVKLGNKVIFWANNGVNGTEPWVTDGTESGTFLLQDMNPGSNSSYPYSTTDMKVVNSKLYFSGYTSNNGYELCVSDGNPWGTYVLKDIYGGTTSSYPSYFTTLENKVYFIASDNISGTELWTSDGTYDGTSIVKDIYPGVYSSYIYGLQEINGKLIFRAESSGNGSELWISNGTSEGTAMLKDINPGYNSSYPQDFIKVGNTIFFSATDGINGRELWKTNATTGGTSMVKDINLTSIQNENFTFSDYGNRKKFLDVNGELFFLANSGPEGFELWKSDGTAAGTTIVKEFVPGPLSTEYNNFQVLGSNLYFSVADSTRRNIYYKSDGTAAGTVAISAINPGMPVENVYPLLAIDNSYFYFAAYNNTVGYELFRTNGNAITLVKDIETNPFYSSNNFFAKTGVGNTLLFTYNDNLHGNEVWKTNGVGNVNLLKEIVRYPSSGSDYYSNSSSISNLITLNNYSYFLGNGAVWRTDGVNVELFNSSGNSVNSIIMSNGKIRWTISNQLYETDGVTVTPITTLGDYSYYGSYLVADVNGISYFTYSTTTYGTELWRTDGTASGTWIVKDITWGSNSTSFGNFRRMGNKLFFVVYDANFGSELWVTDGSDAGTYLVKDIYPGSGGSNPYNLTNLNDNLLIFSANNGANGTELWRSDGTDAGTFMVGDIYGGSSYPSTYEMGEFAVLNNKVYFEAYSNIGYRMYWSDGNTISMVNSEVDPEAMVKFNNQLYFRGAGYIKTEGYELWKTDGTSNGTTLVKDINPGYSSSRPSKFFTYNDLLYFMANDGTHGEELWALTPCADSLNISSSLDGTNTYQASKVIVGEIANTLSANANITYDAGKYVLLKPGFNTTTGAVFQTNLAGCGNNQTQTNTSPVYQPLNAKTAQYIQDMQEAPTVEEFIEKGNNKDLSLICAKYLEDSKTLLDKERQLEYEINTLNAQRSEVKSSKNHDAMVSYYNTRANKEQAFENAKRETMKYSYFITPVKNREGEKLGYDLTINAGEKIYQSSIRY